MDDRTDQSQVVGGEQILGLSVEAIPRRTDSEPLAAPATIPDKTPQVQALPEAHAEALGRLAAKKP